MLYTKVGRQTCGVDVGLAERVGQDGEMQSGRGEGGGGDGSCVRVCVCDVIRMGVMIG